jgi:hypothetical protein
MDKRFPESLFDVIHGRAPSASERMRLLRVKTALGLGDNDEIWPVFLTLDTYAVAMAHARDDILTAVKGMPDRITAAVGEAEKSAEVRANLKIDGLVNKGIERLLLTLKQTQDTADRISKKKFITAATLGCIVVVLCLIFAGAAGYGISNRVMAGHVDTCTSQPIKATDNRWVCYID